MDWVAYRQGRYGCSSRANKVLHGRANSVSYFLRSKIFHVSVVTKLRQHANASLGLQQVDVIDVTTSIDQVPKVLDDHERLFGHRLYPDHIHSGHAHQVLPRRQAQLLGPKP